jgi:hypothetical protein
MARRLSVPAARDWRLTALLMLACTARTVSKRTSACRSARETSLRQSTTTLSSTTVDLALSQLRQHHLERRLNLDHARPHQRRLVGL